MCTPSLLGIQHGKRLGQSDREVPHETGSSNAGQPRRRRDSIDIDPTPNLETTTPSVRAHASQQGNANRSTIRILARHPAKAPPAVKLQPLGPPRHTADVYRHPPAATRSSTPNRPLRCPILTSPFPDRWGAFVVSFDALGRKNAVRTLIRSFVLMIVTIHGINCLALLRNLAGSFAATGKGA